MRTTCLINNYNYEEYVLDAIQSALNQTVSFDEIIVVDDGSSDRSVELLKENYSSCDRIKLIFKENGGQMSCFYEGFLKSSGDLIFFLDADDLYCDNYLEEALNLYKELNCDFLFCSYKDFNGKEEKIKLNYSQTTSLGYSIILASFVKTFKLMGNITSTLSIKRKFLAKIFPYPFMDEWRVEADRCLVFGSSLVGAKKAYCTQTLVKRRIHGKNLYSPDLDSKTYLTIEDTQRYQNILRDLRFKNFISNKMQNGDLYRYITNEFRTIPLPTYVTTKIYVDIVLSLPINLSEKIKKILSIYKYYFISTRKSKERVKFIASE